MKNVNDPVNWQGRWFKKIKETDIFDGAEIFERSDSDEMIPLGKVLSVFRNRYRSSVLTIKTPCGEVVEVPFSEWKSKRLMRPAIGPLTCRKCRCDLRTADALFARAITKPAKAAICRDCYENEVRRKVRIDLLREEEREHMAKLAENNFGFQGLHG